MIGPGCRPITGVDQESGASRTEQFRRVESPCYTQTGYCLCVAALERTGYCQKLHMPCSFHLDDKSDNRTLRIWPLSESLKGVSYG
jgi:hypothetical protein